MKLILGLPYYQHHLAAFVAEPFEFSLKSKAQDSATEAVGASVTSVLHPICRVYVWRKRLAAEKGLTRLQIAEQEGLSNARITQLFSLLKLPKEAQEYLAALTAPPRIRAFSVRQLRGLVRLPASERLEAFRKMKSDCERYS